MKVAPIFPIAVASSKFEIGLTEEQKVFLLNLKPYKNTGNTSSEDTYILRHDVMSNVREWIQSQIDEYVRTIESPLNDVGLRITQSWLNWTKPGERHHKHSHLNSYISGVFYIDVDENTDNICFSKKYYSNIDLGPKKDYNEFNSDSYWLPVETNMLLLFPSTLEHNVDETINNKKTRISLAFNTFPRGFIGEDATMTGLHLS
jgi:uncharacterized protein (TIGR02466 family)